MGTPAYQIHMNSICLGASHEIGHLGGLVMGKPAAQPQSWLVENGDLLFNTVTALQLYGFTLFYCCLLYGLHVNFFMDMDWK